MDKKTLISKRLSDFSEISSLFKAIILLGSIENMKGDDRSDIDICLVTGRKVDPGFALKLVWRKVNPDWYDVKIFEELPLWLKIQIIDEGIVVFAHDLQELSEYLYFYRKLWNDQRWYLERERNGLYYDLMCE